jgi:hypothetical protein
MNMLIEKDPPGILSKCPVIVTNSPALSIGVRTFILRGKKSDRWQ